MTNENAANQPPVDDDPNKEEVARRAYELYETRGREPGHELEDWVHAELELNERRQFVHTGG